VNLIGEHSRGISGAEMFTPGCFDLSTIKSIKGFPTMEGLRKQGKLIFVLNTTQWWEHTPVNASQAPLLSLAQDSGPG
jgi:hypothetical protein